MALALNNLKRVDMPLNKETKPNQTRSECFMEYSTGALPSDSFLLNSEFFFFKTGCFIKAKDPIKFCLINAGSRTYGSMSFSSGLGQSETQRDNRDNKSDPEVTFM